MTVIDESAGKNKAYLARFKDFNVFFEALLQSKEKLNILNTATAIRKMAEIVIDESH